jgi:crotonobetainyl-CoA:carnitine CoA-transferase CaiB-like acyl-CoA transferase
MAGLLRGVKVIESAVLLTGDFLGMLLADEGADVIKIESPGVGDYLREILVMFGPHNSAMHLAVNRNKKSLTLDMRRPEAREVFRRLVSDADVFVTGNIADTPRRLGMDYEALCALKPDIVYCQATGFGAEGPYATIPTHGNMMNALAGGAPLELGPDGRVRVTGPARNGGTGQGVVIGPLYAAFGVAAALWRRERTGRGCYIDVSCADAVIAGSWGGGYNLAELNPGMEREHTGQVVDSAKYQFYQTRDGRYLLFCAIEKKFWDGFCRAAGREDLLAAHSGAATDFGFDDGALRDELQRVFHTRTLAEWTELFVEFDVPAAPALTPAELPGDPHLRARGILVDEDHPAVGRFRALGNPIRVSGESFEIRLHAPALGEHTDEVLAAHGYTPAEIASLREQKVI